LIAELVLIEFRGIDGAQFSSILPDLKYLRIIPAVRALFDYKEPHTTNTAQGLLRRRLTRSWQAVRNQVISYKGLSTYSTAQIVVEVLRVDIHRVGSHNFLLTGKGGKKTLY
jgi:hypothetical protein